MEKDKRRRNQELEKALANKGLRALQVEVDEISSQDLDRLRQMRGEPEEVEVQHLSSRVERD